MEPIEQDTFESGRDHPLHDEVHHYGKDEFQEGLIGAMVKNPLVTEVTEEVYPPSVKTLKDVINELLALMAEVGNVDVVCGENVLEGIPHIEYDADEDRVEIL